MLPWIDYTWVSFLWSVFSLSYCEYDISSVRIWLNDWYYDSHSQSGFVHPDTIFIQIFRYWIRYLYAIDHLLMSFTEHFFQASKHIITNFIIYLQRNHCHWWTYVDEMLEGKWAKRIYNTSPIFLYQRLSRVIFSIGDSPQCTAQ